VAWCNKFAAGGTFLVRFTTQDSLTAAVEALHGSSWRGARFAIAPCAVGALLAAPSGSVQHDDRYLRVCVACEMMCRHACGLEVLVPTPLQALTHPAACLTSRTAADVTLRRPCMLRVQRGIAC
jgi:hypothetical protein